MFATKEIVKEINKGMKSNKRQPNDDWRYEALVQFFDIDKPRPQVSSEDIVEGGDRLAKKMIAVSNWDERKKYFEKLTGYKYK